ncbi:MAG: universal stress protein [Bdellovibrio bacteriovorus]
MAQPPEVGDDVEIEALIENRRRHYRHVLKHLQEVTPPHQTEVRYEVVVGHPAEQIVLHAEMLGADLSVMGHRGNSLLSRWLLGSVVKQVIVHAPCALTVVR